MKREAQPPLSVKGRQALDQYASAFQQVMAEVVPLHRLAQIMGYDSLNTTMPSIRGTKQDLQQDVEKIAWK